MNLKWVRQNEHLSSEIEELVLQLNISPIIAQILLNRGINSFEIAKQFFRADLDSLHDPFLFNDMEKAVERILHAISANEKIMIYGDYDVDGVTAISLLIRVFRDELKYDNMSFYVPDRLREGYGLSSFGINSAKKQGISLIITVDCGITAYEEISLAKDYGIDVIVTDHHVPGQKLPEAIAVIDPKGEQESYPFKELAGVGVAFKLIQAVFIRLEQSQELLRKYTVFVAIGSSADIVPLVDENRIFVRIGLKQMLESQNIGLKALLEISRLKLKTIGTGQIVFIIAPRINAVGRMGNAAQAVRLLITDKPEEAKRIAGILEIENRHRKEIDEKTFIEAQEIIEADESDPIQQSAFILSKQNWHSGVIGIVASRIVEEYYRPTVLISVKNGIGKGSARSIPGFNLYEALKECSDLMISFGGHKYAAGLSIKSDNIATFRNRFIEIAESKLDENLLIQKLRIDAEILLKQIDAKFMRIIKQFGPFGPQNMRPVFVSENLEVVGTPTIVGKNHLKFKVKQDSVVMDAIGFNLGDLRYRLAPGEKNLNMTFVIDENEWLGRTTIQLRVKDLV